MGRLIKFRIWSYDSSKFISLNYRAGDPCYDNQYYNCLFQQYIGIKDENNIELCEGDIINGLFTLDREIEGPISYSVEKCGWVVNGVPINDLSNIKIINNIFKKSKDDQCVS